jgi:hypothetical protein
MPASRGGAANANGDGLASGVALSHCLGPGDCYGGSGIVPRTANGGTVRLRAKTFTPDDVSPHVMAGNVSSVKVS